MRRITQISVAALALTALLCGQPLAGMFPESVTYRYYVNGTYRGKNDIEVTETDDAIVFEGTSEFELGAYSQKLETRTEVDKETFLVRYFSYEGAKVGKQIEGTVWVEGKKIKGTLIEDGNSFPSKKTVELTTVFFQNYHMEHQIALANLLDKSGKPFVNFFTFFPSDFMFGSTLGVLQTEFEFETKNSKIICKLFSVAVERGETYYSYFDIDKHLPVYLDFPGSRTEVFLESEYGTDPETKYVEAEAGN